MIVLTTISGYILSAYGLEKHYVCGMDIYIESTDGENPTQKAATAALLFTSPQMYDAINSHLSEKFTYAEFGKMLSVTQVNGTQLLRAEVDCRNSDTAYRLAEKYLELMQGVLDNYKANAKITVINAPYEPDYPVFPNDTIFTAAGAIFGFLISAIGIIIIWRLDNTITPADNLAEEYGVTVLGELMDFDREIDYLGR